MPSLKIVFATTADLSLQLFVQFRQLAVKVGFGWGEFVNACVKSIVCNAMCSAAANDTSMRIDSTAHIELAPSR